MKFAKIESTRGNAEKIAETDEMELTLVNPGSDGRADHPSRCGLEFIQDFFQVRSGG